MFEFCVRPWKKIRQFLYVIDSLCITLEFSFANKCTVYEKTPKKRILKKGETFVHLWYSFETGEKSESGQCRLFEFFGCRNPWDYVSPCWAFVLLYSEGIRFVKLFRRLERKTTLWPNEMPSARTDSNEPAPCNDSKLVVLWTTTSKAEKLSIQIWFLNKYYMHQHYYCLQFRNILNVSNVPKDFPDMIQCNVYVLITLSAAANHVFIKNSCSDDANVASAQWGLIEVHTARPGFPGRDE